MNIVLAYYFLCIYNQFLVKYHKRTLMIFVFTIVFIRNVFCIVQLNRGFEHRSGRTKHNIIQDICYFPAKQTVLMSQRKVQLCVCLMMFNAIFNNIFKTGWLGFRITCSSGATCLHADYCFSELVLLKSNSDVGLVLSEHLYYYIECSLFSSRLIQLKYCSFDLKQRSHTHSNPKDIIISSNYQLTLNQISRTYRTIYSVLEESLIESVRSRRSTL